MTKISPTLVTDVTHTRLSYPTVLIPTGVTCQRTVAWRLDRHRCCHSSEVKGIYSHRPPLQCSAHRPEAIPGTSAHGAPQTTSSSSPATLRSHREWASVRARERSGERWRV